MSLVQYRTTLEHAILLLAKVPHNLPAKIGFRRLPLWVNKEPRLDKDIKLRDCRHRGSLAYCCCELDTCSIWTATACCIHLPVYHRVGIRRSVDLLLWKIEGAVCDPRAYGGGYAHSRFWPCPPLQSRALESVVAAMTHGCVSRHGSPGGVRLGNGEGGCTLKGYVRFRKRDGWYYLYCFTCTQLSQLQSEYLFMVN